MKLTPWIRRSLAGVAFMSLVLGSTAIASDTGTVYAGKYRVVKDGKYVIYTETTNSRIPERVVLKGQQVNTASPMYVVQGKDLLRTGATNIVGILALDPSISSRHGGM
jgi:hypothetical protein